VKKQIPSNNRPITISEGTNVLAGTDPQAILGAAGEILEGRAKRGRRPALWDGRAAERIVEILLRAAS
jgi:UDP-N-acetylglucosamine 2-epimerase (non-hydrolysing)